MRDTAGTGCQHLSRSTRLQRAWLPGRHCSHPPLRLPNSVPALHTALRCVRHSGAPFTIPGGQVLDSTRTQRQLPSPGPSVPRSRTAPGETSSPPSASHRAHPGPTGAVPDPSPQSRWGQGQPTGARRRDRPSPAGRAPLASLPALTCPSWRRRAGGAVPEAPGRRGRAEGAARRDTRLGTAAAAPPGSANPAPARRSGPPGRGWEPRPAVTQGSPPGPAHTFPIKGKKYGVTKRRNLPRADPAAPGHGSWLCPAAGSSFAPPGSKHFGSYYEPGREKGGAEGAVLSQSHYLVYSYIWHKPHWCNTSQQTKKPCQAGAATAHPQGEGKAIFWKQLDGILCCRKEEWPCSLTRTPPSTTFLITSNPFLPITGLCPEHFRSFTFSDMYHNVSMLKWASKWNRELLPKSPFKLYSL